MDNLKIKLQKNIITKMLTNIIRVELPAKSYQSK